MTAIADIKELECPATPLLLLDCMLRSGDLQHWSTHSVTVNNVHYEPRVLQHNLLEMKSSSDNATDGVSNILITLANADGELSPIERSIGWKGAKLTVTFVFFDLVTAAPASESRVVFRGIANSPDESTETSLKLSFTSRLSLSRIYLPETRIQKQCPWSFPSDSGERSEALNGTKYGSYSSLFRCGYSPDLSGGVGNLNGTQPFTTCDYSRSKCIERGMFSQDASGHTTSCFGGVEFLPPSIVVRGYRESGSHISTTVDNQAKYNDCVPLLYGTGWYQPSIVFARNDGNLTRMEVLLGAGEITSVLSVVVNDIEIPAGVAGTNMTATGWYNVISYGKRNGTFNKDFTDAQGNPLGDPYGSLAYMSVVVPNIVNDGRSLPSIQVLTRGLKLQRFDNTGAPSANPDYTNNPVWILLDVLRRSGWTLDEIDLPSFSAAAQICDQPVQTTDLNGNSTQIPRYQCNLLLTQVKSASDIVRGIRNGSGLFLNFTAAGLLGVSVEDTLAAQQAVKPAGSNSTSTLNGGWPAYEFGDNALSGIAIRTRGESTLRVYSQSSANTTNRFTVEFQDEFNAYQQDSYALVDTTDTTAVGQQTTSALPVAGIPNVDQAARIAFLFLSKSIYGNTYITFDTSVKSVQLSPGDIIALTYAREGFNRQPFRITRISPSMNYRRATITAQLHDDAWYSASNVASGTARPGIAQIGIPRPLVGTTLDAGGDAQFGIAETTTLDTDGTTSVQLSVSFTAPPIPAATTVSIPLVSLQAIYQRTGGNIPGDVSSYYAISAVDASGAEGRLSFSVLSATPAGTNTNTVTLQNLSFSSTATSFNVYRGQTPSSLLRIASDVAIATQFVDTGLTAQLQGPPDANFDHANFYWRFVLRPEQRADIHTVNTIGMSQAGMQANEFRGAIVRLAAGIGAGQERTVVSNTASTLTVAPKWDIIPDETSEFLLADTSWQFGATATSSPVAFEVPNRTGAIVQISGRSANVQDDECSYALSPLTSWKISGGAGSALDQDVPPQPSFGLFATGQGAIEVVGIGFSDLTNTRGVVAGTLSLLYIDEIAGATAIAIASAISESDQTMTLSNAATAQAGDVLQIENELILVTQDASSVTSLEVTRGAYGSTAQAHNTGVLATFLSRKTFVMPFAQDFFGTSASGSYSFRVTFPNVRIVAADFFVTNSKGNSSVMQRSYAGIADGGIRTLTGGQISIQVDGLLAIQNDVAPPVIVDSPHAVRDIFANVGTAATESSVDLQINQNGQSYCTLSIPAGASVSNVVDGLTLASLQGQAQLTLDITGVPQTADSVPGADLTVTIRL